MSIIEQIKRNFLQGDRLIVTMISVLLFFYLKEALVLEKTNLEDAVGPGGFPVLLGITGVILCGIYFINVFRGRMAEYEKIEGLWAEIKGVAMLFMVIAYVIFIDLITYEAATFIFMTLGVKFLGERTWYGAAIVAGVLTFACYMFFVWFLDIRFQTGDFWLMLKGV